VSNKAKNTLSEEV